MVKGSSIMQHIIIGKLLQVTTEISSESTVIFYQIRYVMNAMIKSDEFNKIHCRSHNVNVYLMIMSAKKPT